MRILITGGAGFLGAWIIRRLEPTGVALRVLDAHGDRSRVTEIAGPEVAAGLDWAVGDVAHGESVARAAGGCDVIIHTAGLLTPACREDPLLGARVNVLGTLNVFEAARTHGIPRVVYTSSGGVFGPEDGSRPFPMTHYGVFKLANEGSARAYWAEAGIASIGLRPFVVYGPGREGGLTAGITAACRAAALGQAYVIPVTGRAGLVYVDDVAAACAAAATTETPGARTLNLPGTVATMGEVVTTIRRVVPGARITCDGPPVPSSPDAPNEFGSGLLPLAREHTLDEGIAETIDYYRGAGGRDAGRRTG